MPRSRWRITGWRYIAEELGAAGIAAHVAEPTDTAFARGRMRRAPVTRPARSQNPAAIKGQGADSGTPRTPLHFPVNAGKAARRAGLSRMARRARVCICRSKEQVSR